MFIVVSTTDVVEAAVFGVGPAVVVVVGVAVVVAANVVAAEVVVPVTPQKLSHKNVPNIESHESMWRVTTMTRSAVMA